MEEPTRTENGKFTYQDACMEGFRPERELVDAYLSREIEIELNQEIKRGRNLEEKIDALESRLGLALQSLIDGDAHKAKTTLEMLGDPRTKFLLS